MNFIKVYSILFLLLTLNSYGQKLNDVNSYLDNNQISKIAKTYYLGKFKAIDNNKTFSIVDSLKTNNDKTRPFYLLLVSIMTLNSDGALSESLSMAFKSFLESNPDNLLDFFSSIGIDKKYVDNWAKLIAEEIMIECEGKEKECVDKSKQLSNKKCSIVNKKLLDEFYNKVATHCQ